METTHLVSEFIAKILLAFNEGQAMAYRIFWDAGMQYLSEHWIAIAIFLVVIFLVAVIRAISGYWGMLGSFLYKVFFLGTLFIIGLIWGPEVFASNYLAVWLVILYIICYFTVGRVLNFFGFTRRINY